MELDARSLMNDSLLGDGVCWANDCDCPRWHPIAIPDPWTHNSLCLRDRDLRIEALALADVVRSRLDDMSRLELSAWLHDDDYELWLLAQTLRAEIPDLEMAA